MALELNALSCFSLGLPVFQWVKATVPAPATIVELGSGDGTAVLVNMGYKVWSVEHDEAWLHKHGSTYVHAPITAGWYETNIISATIPPQHELLIIDGPPGEVGRQGVLEHMHLFDSSAWIIFDDVHRVQDRSVARRLSEQLGRPMRILASDLGRQFAVM